MHLNEKLKTLGPSIRSGNWNRVGLVGGLVRGFVVHWKVISIDGWNVPIPQCILSSKLFLTCNLVCKIV